MNELIRPQEYNKQDIFLDADADPEIKRDAVSGSVNVNVYQDQRNNRRGSFNDDNIFSNRDAAHDKLANRTQFVGPSNGLGDKENSAIDLNGLGAHDDPDDQFEEIEDGYGNDDSLRVKDTTIAESDALYKNLYMNLAGRKQEELGTSRDSNLIIPSRPSKSRQNRTIFNQANGTHYQEPSREAAKSSLMGLDADEGNIEDAAAMELNQLNEGHAAGALAGQANGGSQAGQKDTIKVRVFVNMDEDDDGSKGINPNDIFQRENEKLPFFIDLQIQDHFNYKQLLVDTVDALNQALTEQRQNADPASQSDAYYQMDDDPANYSKNYNIYLASKKKGTAKEDYPSLSLESNVKRSNASNFSLSCFSCAFIEQSTKIELVQNQLKNASMDQKQLAENQQLDQQNNEQTAHSDRDQIQNEIKDKVHSTSSQNKRKTAATTSGRNSALNELQHTSDQKGCCSGCSIF